jgi:hypothetical protein
MIRSARTGKPVPLMADGNVPGGKVEYRIGFQGRTGGWVVSFDHDSRKAGVRIGPLARIGVGKVVTVSVSWLTRAA